MDKKEYTFEELDDLDDVEDFEELDDLDNISEIDDLLEELDDEQVDDKISVDSDKQEDIKEYPDEYLDDDEKESGYLNSNNKVSHNKVLVAKILIPIIFLLVIGLLVIKGCSKNDTYIVKFNTVGGTNVTTQKVKANTKVDIPNDPVKEGYTFLGWYLDGEKYDFDTKVTSNIVLEARWESAKTAKVTGVSLDQTSVTILPGNSVVLVATVEPSDAKDSNVIWTSSNDKIATVDSNGNVKAISLGTVVITAITTDGNYKAACSVTVSENVVNVTDISFSKSTLELSTNDVVSLTATITPANATNKGIIWSSSNDSVVKVMNGRITAVSAGTAVITATTKDGNKTATINVTVKDVPVTSVTVKPTTLNMTIGDKPKQLTATITPINASNKGVTWKSGNNAIASVDSKGIVTALGAGTTTITATTKDGGKIAIVTINVSKPVEASGVSISGPTSVVEGKSITLSAVVKPTNAVNKTIKWSSSDTSIATVNSNGIVTGVKVGEVTITATTVNGKLMTYHVTVTKSIIVKEYSYSYTKKQADEHAPIYYYVKVYEDGADVTNKVTNLAGMTIKKPSDTITVADINYEKLTENITIIVNGETKTATLK